MKPLSYSLEDISSAIVDHLRRKYFTERQLEGLAKFKSKGGWASVNPEDPDNLKKWFDILNSVLFNGVLSGYCELAFFPRSRRGSFWDGAAAYCTTRVPGEELDSRFRNEKVRVSIGIKRIDSKVYNQYPLVYKGEKYRNYLVHEMLHAAFVIYACRCEYGCREIFRESIERFGGHDMPWMEAAYAIENADKAVHTKKTQFFEEYGIMGETLAMDLNKSMSLLVSWDYIPPDTELRRVGLDIKRIREELAWLRGRKAKEYRKDQQQKHLRKANRCLRYSWIVDSDCERCTRSDSFSL